MSMHVTCRCGQAFAADAHLAGTTVACPVCGAALAIPAAPQANARPAFSSPPIFVWILAAAGGVVLLLLAAIAGGMLLWGDNPRPLAGSRVAAPAQPPKSPVYQPAKPPSPAPASPQAAPSQPEQSARPKPALPNGVFVIDPDMYEITVPGAERIEGGERLSSAGLTITGAAKLPSLIKGPEIRSNIEQFRAGNTANLGDLMISWALIIKAQPREPGPVKNPTAQPVTVGGLTGLEVSGPKGGHVTWAFGFHDHTLMLSAIGPPERVASAEVRSILNTLRRTGNVPTSLAERARSGGGR
jgi:hypothetical protein